MIDMDAKIENFPMPPTLAEGIMALAAAARNSTRDDRGTLFVMAHILRMLRATEPFETDYIKLQERQP